MVWSIEEADLGLSVWVTYHQLLCRRVRINPFLWKFCRVHYPVTPRRTTLGYGRIIVSIGNTVIYLTCDYFYLIYLLTLHFLATPAIFASFHLQLFPFWKQRKTWCPEHLEWLNQVFPCIARGMSIYANWERGGRHYTRMIEWSKWNTTIWSTIWEKMGCLQLHVSLSNVSHLISVRCGVYVLGFKFLTAFFTQEVDRIQ